MSLRDIIEQFVDERDRAIAKHGFEQTPAAPDMPDEKRLVIVAEEFGEVARAITYDEGDRDKLREELIQLGTMAFMWVEGLGTQEETDGSQ